MLETAEYVDFPEEVAGVALGLQPSFASMNANIAVAFVQMAYSVSRYTAVLAQEYTLAVSFHQLFLILHMCLVDCTGTGLAVFRQGKEIDPVRRVAIRLWKRVELNPVEP